MMMKNRFPRSPIWFFCLLLPLWGHASLAWEIPEGAAERDGEGWKILRNNTPVLLEDLPRGDFIWETTVRLAETRQPIALFFQPHDREQVHQRAEGHISLGRDADGLVISGRHNEWDEERNRWVAGPRELNFSFRYWPAERDARTRNQLAEAGIEPRTWVGRDLPLRIDFRDGEAWLWVEDRFVGRVALDPERPRTLALRLGEGDVVFPGVTREWDFRAGYLPVSIGAQANARGATALDVLNEAGTPFLLQESGNDLLNLGSAGWVNQLLDPSSYYSPYHAGPPFLNDERMPMFTVPNDDYVAIHVLAYAGNDPETIPGFTSRVGRYNGGQAQVVQFDFFGEVPTFEGDPSLVAVRIPWSVALSQDVEGDLLDFSLTREVRLAVRRPDPNRFQFRPVGLPSGVRIAGITLERSPLSFRVSSDETAHAFNEPQVPTFKVDLTNRTNRRQAYQIVATARDLEGAEVVVRARGRIQGGESETVEIEIPVERGYHDLTFELQDGSGNPLLRRETAMALLPEDTRQHRHTSRFGTWDFSGGHFTSRDPDQVGPLYAKLGIRFGMFGFPVEALEKYGVWYGSEANVHTGPDRMMSRIDGRGDRWLNYGQVFHETSISGPHSSRIPDLFHDRPPYELNERELERFATMWTQATEYVDQARERFPTMHMRFGNGPIAVREEFYRRGLPADKFDSGGNESAVFGRMPEAQPPDIVTLNATMWMDRQLLDHYGYEDKPVTLGYEVIYPNTNPGNLDYLTQADYFVRHALHAWAWGAEHIRPGAISDMGNSYRHSNWGSSGFTRHRPEFSVKPSFVSFATMTLVLDGAEFVQVVDAGSDSVYLFEFRRPDGSPAWVLWTVRGTRPVQMELENASGVLLINDQARETPLEVTDGSVEFTISPSPVYLVADAGSFAGITLGEPDHSDAIPWETERVPLANLGDSESWEVVQERSTLLENYNNKTALRRFGNFSFETVSPEFDKSAALRVTPHEPESGVPTMPMYRELRHTQGIPIEGEPTALGLWVNGNSGWGRVIFELEDASGQTWTSIGAAQTGDVSPWLQDWMPDDLIDAISLAGFEDWNTNDIYGYSRFNFDGWRLVQMPLPGHYPGEPGKRYHWYRTSQWRFDGDGQVHYPLTLRKVIVELNEKVLHSKDFRTPRRVEVELGDLEAIYGQPHQPRDFNRHGVFGWSHGAP